MPVSRHLSPDQLIAASEGTLSEESRAHLAACARCTREVETMSHMLQLMASDELELPPARATATVLAMLPAAPPQPSLLQRLQAVLRLDSSAGTLAYGVRGGQGKSRQLLFSAGPYEIDVRVRPQTQGWLVMGQLLGEAVVGMVRLTNETHSYSGTINELGEFEFDGVPSGNYTLIVALEDSELEISTIPLE